MTKRRLAFLVNGTPASAMGIRAQSFAERLDNQFDISIAYRSANKLYSILRNLIFLVRYKPVLCYVFDMGFSGVIAAGIYGILSGCRVVVDTGDAIGELMRRTGNRGPFGIWLTECLEGYALAISDRVVVRSHPHRELLAARGVTAVAIPDGVDLKQFAPREEDQLRKSLGLEGALVVGILGSLVWSRRLQLCYGWELLEVVHRLRERSVKGLVIGDGTGLERLKAHCADLGIADRVVFVGRIPYAELPRYLNVMDVCISTQTNDAVGQVRTSGKLPLYLACGRRVLATDVGEAALVLPPSMVVSYRGTNDTEYPAHLAERVRTLLDQPETLDQRNECISIARRHFDYEILAQRVGETIWQVLSPNGKQRSRAPAIRDSQSVDD